jgi:hypothetical protein
MLFLRLDEELGFGPAGPGDFWSYPGPIGSDGGVEPVRATKIDFVVDLFPRFHLRPKQRLSSKIEGEMNPKPARRRDRLARFSHGTEA